MQKFGGSVSFKKQPSKKVAEPHPEPEADLSHLPIGEKMKKFGGSKKQNAGHAKH